MDEKERSREETKTEIEEGPDGRVQRESLWRIKIWVIEQRTKVNW